MANYDVFITPARGSARFADHQPDRPSSGLLEGQVHGGLPRR
jgi:hypothetical protein